MRSHPSCTLLAALAAHCALATTGPLLARADERPPDPAASEPAAAPAAASSPASASPAATASPAAATASPAAAASPAATASPAVLIGRRGVILQIEDGRAIVDLGKNDGVREDLPVRVFKRYVLVHPITKAKIEDELPLGAGKIVKVSERIASVDVSSIAKALVGDVILVEGVAPPPSAPSASTPTAPTGAPPVVASASLGCAPCRTDPAARALHEAWVAALPLDVEGRKASWLRFLMADPKTKYRNYVVSEIAFLSALLAAPKPGAAWAGRPLADESLDQLYEGEPLSPAVIVPDAHRFHLKAVHLFHRAVGAPLFERIVMRPDGDGYFRATVPAAAVRAPGVEYFVETLDAAGRTARVLASAASPWRVTVERAPVKADERRGRSTLSFGYSFVDYYLSGASGYDYFWRLDGAFTYRTDFHALQYFKLGFGYFQGNGGEVVRVQSAAAAGASGSLDQLAFAFAYLEPEIVFHPLFAILPRLTVGQIDKQKLLGQDAGRHTEQIFGFHTYLRIGKREGTNLLVGGGFTQDAGFETQLRLELGLLPRTPIAFSAVVSNVPVNKDVGLELRGEIGQRIGDFLEIGAHLGFAVRNINHAGVSVGTHVNFKW